jgi:large subunit ribosomal protein L6
MEFIIKPKYTLKVPKTINIFYCTKKKIIVFEGPLKKKSLKLNVKIFFNKKNNIIFVSSIKYKNSCTKFKKKAKIIQGTTVSLFKHAMVEINYRLYQKLKIVGVGYKVFQMEEPINKHVYFKLGYSHLIFFKIPYSIQTFSIKFVKLFIYGNISYASLTNTVSLIKSFKKPEPYKGKGILNYHETIILKKGKKI